MALDISGIQNTPKSFTHGCAIRSLQIRNSGTTRCARLLARCSERHHPVNGAWKHETIARASRMAYQYVIHLVRTVR